MAPSTRAQAKVAKAEEEEAQRRQARADELAQMPQTRRIAEELRGLPPPTPPPRTANRATPAGSSQHHPVVVQASSTPPQRKRRSGRSQIYPFPEEEDGGVEAGIVLDHVQPARRRKSRAPRVVSILRSSDENPDTPRPQRRVSFGDIEWRPILDAPPGERTCAPLGSPANSNSSDDVDEEAKKNERINERTRVPLAGRRPGSGKFMHDWSRFEEEGEMFKDPVQPRPDGSVQEAPARVSLRRGVIDSFSMRQEEGNGIEDPNATTMQIEKSREETARRESTPAPVTQGQGDVQSAPVSVPVQPSMSGVPHDQTSVAQKRTITIPWAVRVVVFIIGVAYILEWLTHRKSDSRDFKPNAKYRGRR